ncbi:MAG: alpha/beta fold hydrolase [Deltaproteobacteria bacterium]|nr:MAG: alpha/beta fold hydrolase [Deltaproteobacteria bacterium]
MDLQAIDSLLEGEYERSRRDGVGEEDLPFATVPAEATVAVLLVHGFSATPWEMRPLAADLAKRGFASLAVRLPGHGTTPEDLAGRRWEEWQDTVLRGYDLLAARYHRVYGAGLSTGALLLLALARQRRPAGAVLLSPYLRLRHSLAPIAGWLRFLKPYQHRTVSGSEAGHYYARRPLAGVHQINRLVRELSPRLGEIDLPVLAIHGEGDRTIDIDSGRQLVDRMSSKVKVYERLGPEAPHVLIGTGNPLREAVFDLVGKFLGELESQECPAESSR